jgi:hypothetical protein
MQFCTMEIKDTNRTLKLVLTYLSPKSPTRIDNLFNDNIQNSSHFVALGDFNARVGDVSQDHVNAVRKTKDMTINARGKALVEFLKTTDFIIMNGCSRSDKNGEFTFVNKNGSSCIDLCLVSKSVFGTADFKVLDFEGSCHFATLFSMNVDQRKPSLQKIMKCSWNDQKAEDFQNALHNHLNYYPNTSITMSHYASCVSSGLTDTNMIRKKRTWSKYYS